MAGRRRDPALDAAIHAAATELLHERGEAVAVRVGVPKSTVYKRWSSRVHLASAILDDWVAAVISQVEEIAKAQTDDRLRLLIRTQSTFTSGAEGRAVTEVLVSDVDEPAVIALRKRAGEYREICHRVFASVATDLGTPSNVDVHLVADMLLGAIWLRSLRGLGLDEVNGESLHSSVLQLLRP